jgi:uncharacterized protein (TIGR00299 family) protein
MHVHLDPIGGVAGDMFIAAILDAFPEFEAGMLDSLRAVGLGRTFSCGLVPARGSAIQGPRFLVEALAPEDDEAHAHTTWLGIRGRLEGSALSQPVKGHAIGLFSLLAETEAHVHGVDPEQVSFHELGAADSIADVVGAAHLIAALSAERWSIASLPLGSGCVQTDHGLLPVPAPATALLLQGYSTREDGVSGERVTPTGAAIIRHLKCTNEVYPHPRTLGRSGTGFGSKELPGIANCLRVLVFEVCAGRTPHRELAVVQFEVDDQSAEELAVGLDALRRTAGVWDVLQMPAFGKKGRIMAHIQLLANPAALPEVIAACFRETTTIGLRYQMVGGAALDRHSMQVVVEGRPVRVKIVDRPGGRTAKAEVDDVADAASGHAGRSRVRRAAERQAERSAASENAPELQAESTQRRRR